jgi:hypothetical protein
MGKWLAETILSMWFEYTISEWQEQKSLVSASEQEMVCVHCF